MFGYVLGLACLLFVACGSSNETGAITGPVRGSVRRPDPIAPGVTHGGSITLVAVTDEGDAALSVDVLGGVRVWPSLDGKRPPVPVDAVGVGQIAIGHAGDELLAAFSSNAGDVSLVRLGLDGAVHGRTQLPGDVGCEQVIAIAGGVIVVRADPPGRSHARRDLSRGRRRRDGHPGVAQARCRRGTRGRRDRYDVHPSHSEGTDQSRRRARRHTRRRCRDHARAEPRWHAARGAEPQRAGGLRCEGDREVAHPSWKPQQVVFSSDSHYVILKSEGGLVSFDAATGARIAAACAFDFGLHDKPTPTNTLNALPVCEAPPRRSASIASCGSVSAPC